MKGPGQDVPGSDGIGDTPYVIDENNTDHYPLILNPLVPAHDIAVNYVVLSKTVIGLGFSGNVTIYVINDGQNAETFNVTAYANGTTIDTQQVNNLNATGQMTLTFTLNTTGFAYGNYTISAYVWPIQGETNTANNNFVGGSVLVTIPGDLNGDFKVSRADLVVLANAYGSEPGDVNWNPNADIKGNGIIGLSDLVILAQHYGQHYP
jgi:hypothetical protein